MQRFSTYLSSVTFAEIFASTAVDILYYEDRAKSKVENIHFNLQILIFISLSKELKTLQLNSSWSTALRTRHEMREWENNGMKEENRECSLKLQIPMLVTGLEELEMLLDDHFEYKNRDIYDMRGWVKKTMKKEGKKHIFKGIHINLQIWCSFLAQKSSKRNQTTGLRV